jgi:hypothetical protein
VEYAFGSRADWRARGELGWSSEWRKQELDRAETAGSGQGPQRSAITGRKTPAPVSVVRAFFRNRQSSKWRQYICESFCDTSAWIYSGVKSHEEFTLARRWRTKRCEWFKSTVEARKSIRI